MRISNKHIIQKQFIEVEMQNAPDAFAFRNRLGELYYQRILPALEDMFDEIATEHRSIRKDSLIIDLGVISSKNWEEVFVDGAIHKIKESLMLGNDATVIDDKSFAEPKSDTHSNIEEIFLYFLHNGFLPWYVAHDYNLKNELAIWMEQQPSAFKNTFLGILSNSDEKILLRLFYQLDEVVLNKAFFLLLEERPGEKAACEKMIRMLTTKKNEDTANLLPSINQLLSLLNILPAAKEIEVKESEEQTDGIYIQNAGLIILHPFLPPFFNYIGLTDVKNSFKDEASHQKAVLITQYLVTGETKIAEEDIVLNKIICGYSIDHSITNELILSDLEINETKDLLTQIIQLWKVNDKSVNTSIEGLQESFLQRQGKLIRKENGWLLQIEQMGVDVLLSKLPWGIGIVKAPWMKGILHVEWF